MGRYSVVLPQCRFDLSTALAILAFTFTPFAIASTAAEGPEIALLVGEGGSDYERVGLSLRFGPLWSADWAARSARLHPHYGNGRWRPFAEAGLGVSLFNRDRLGNKDFGSRFQFSQHLAVGVELAQRGYAGLQYSHYSNADIEKPNDGIDLHQIVIWRTFLTAPAAGRGACPVAVEPPTGRSLPRTSTFRERTCGIFLAVCAICA